MSTAFAEDASKSSSATVAPAASAAPATTTVSPTDAPAQVSGNPDEPAPKVMFKPGQELSVEGGVEDIHPTFDVELARKQVAAYSDSPEAVFILAVALTRTSRVEEALNEVKHARRLAAKQGGAAYFDKMIAEYEKGLEASPNDNETRYGLAWAYYMKGYLLGEQSRRVAKWRAANPELAKLQDAAAAGTAGGAAPNTAPVSATATAAPKTETKNQPAPNNVDVVKAITSGSPAALLTAAQAVTSGAVSAANLPHIPGALENCMPQDVAAIRSYYELAIGKLDDLLTQQPDDVWSIAYRAHLNAEFTGQIQPAIKVWLSTKDRYPNNPASYFFLGEAFLKLGDLKQALMYVSRALALRSIGN